MIDEHKAELKKHLLWMKGNWEKNQWYSSGHHYSQIWPAICNLATDQHSENDLNTLIGVVRGKILERGGSVT